MPNDPAVLRVGGVPEHFNYPWKMAEELGLYKKYGVQVEFVIQKCGTGAMIQALKNKEQDVVVALTEGLVADIAKGSNLKLLGTYVSSSLCWALSAGANNSKISSVEDLKGATFAVSRYGSGSHLMASVLASQKGWGKDSVKFKVIGDFKKLRDSVNAETTDVFMWETFTTKPYHDSGEIKRVGEIYTPWPCFMLAAREDVANEKADLIKKAMLAVREAAKIFHSKTEEMPSFISKNYNLKLEDAKTWYSKVQIVASPEVSSKAIQTALDSLGSAGVLTEENYPVKKPLWHFVEPNVATIKTSDESKSRKRPFDTRLQVGYWKIRGLAAPLRMMCSYANAEWENVAYPARVDAEGKPDRSSWMVDAKPYLIKKNPLLNLPYVFEPDTGKLISQSLACMIFLAEKFGLLGDDLSVTGRAKVHQLLCEAHDLRNAAVKAFYSFGNNTHHQYAEKIIFREYAKFEAWLGDSKTTFLAGNKPTVPDFHLWEMLDQNEQFAMKLKTPSFLKDYKNLAKYYSDFRALPELITYFEGDMYKKYSCNNPYAKFPLSPA